MSCNKPCEGCAFTPGAAANRELYNHLKGVICLLGPLPFVCHHGQDWQNPENHKLSPKQIFRRGWKICEGWRAAVSKLAATGYYAKPELTKAFAECALRELDIFSSKNLAEEDRAEAQESLANFLARLYRRYERFTGEDLSAKMNELAETGYFKGGE